MTVRYGYQQNRECARRLRQIARGALCVQKFPTVSHSTKSVRFRP